MTRKRESRPGGPRREKLSSSPTIQPVLTDSALQRVRIRGARVRSSTTVEIPWDSLRQGAVETLLHDDRDAVRPNKIHSEVRKMRNREMARLRRERRQGNKTVLEKRERLIVSFHDELVMPRFAAMFREPMSRRERATARRAAERLSDEIEQARKPVYDRLAGELRRDYRAKVVESPDR